MCLLLHLPIFLSAIFLSSASAADLLVLMHGSGKVERYDAEGKAAREAVRDRIKLTHRTEEVMAAGDALARMLRAVAAGADLREAIFEHGADWFSQRKAEQWSREPDKIVSGPRVSPAYYIADAFPPSPFSSAPMRRRACIPKAPMARASASRSIITISKGAGEYIELEQLSPLRRLDKGIALTTRWRIHAISETSPESKMREMVRLLSSAEK